ncbi:hypothetical protein SLEP1_g57617 [Rubroshorea leprosula]|uniref:Uncharacterized protein n=1 Tax=Rubroshorea leprosula TaxID=152421 RepID=A0AAV5MN09_9ROSI|nr:hypothetical protein SLEP1_g57617 [Rubroshorea leprosula]
MMRAIELPNDDEIGDQEELTRVRYQVPGAELDVSLEEHMALFF